MGAPFRDITIYAPSQYTVGTPEYSEEISLQNFVSDLYMQKMNGYKPPKTTSITIQPAFHNTWHRTWKNGSIVATAPYFNYDEYAALDKSGKYKYILDLIQSATLPLSEEYEWDKTVFENAYQEVLKCNFEFKIDYPAKQSRDRKKIGFFSIQKTETTTSAFVSIEADGSTVTRKLFEKKNIWWYDCVYILARHNKWLDTDKFGISYNKGRIDIWHSLENDEVALFDNGAQVTEIDFRKHFLFG